MAKAIQALTGLFWLAVALVLGASAALGASPGCTNINNHSLDYSGKPGLIALGAELNTFFAGDRINLTYTTSSPQAGVILQILSTGNTLLGATVTGTNLSYNLSGIMPTTGPLQLVQLGYVDASAILSQRNITVTFTCTPALAATTTAFTNGTPMPAITFGQSATYDVAVTSAGGTPAGTVDLLIDGAVAQTRALSAGGLVSFPVSGLGGGGHTISANYNGNANFATSSGILTGGQTVNKGATAINIVTSQASVPYGQAATITATVTALVPASGIPTGNVIFSVNGADQPAVALSGSGQATFSTAGLPVNTHTITARYVGSADFATSTTASGLTQTVTLGGTNLALTAAPVSPTVWGQSPTFTATVTPTVGSATVPGSVTFTIDGVVQPATAMTNGVATFSVPGISAGPHKIEANYYGTSNYGTSSGIIDPYQVNKSVTNAVLSGPSTVVFGQTATYTATVTSGTGGVPNPTTGSVAFTVGGTTVNVPVNASGVASYTYTPTAATAAGSPLAVSASYLGTANYGVSNTAVLAGGLTVSKANTNITVSSLPSPTSYQQSATFTAVVSSSAGIPTGSVNFIFDGGTPINAPLVNGQAQISKADLSVGSHALSVTYAATSDLNAGAGTLTHVVNPANVNMTLASTANPAVWGQPARLVAEVASPYSPGGTYPTGSVKFTVGALAPQTVALTSGRAELDLAPLGLAPGNYAVTAEYTNGGDFAPKTMTLAGGQQINKAGTTSSITANPSGSSTYNGSVTFSATIAPVAPGAGTPTGNVIFSIDGVPQVTPAPLNGSGVATLTTTGLSVGPHAITTFYAGDSHFSGSNGALSPDYTTGKVATVTTLSGGNPTTGTFGQPLTLTASVSSSQGAPAGIVHFTVGSHTYDVPLQGGTASRTISDVEAGTHTVTAAYVATPNFSGSTSANGSLTISAADPSVTISSSANPANPNDTPMFTVGVTAPGATPQGTVTIRVGALTPPFTAAYNGTPIILGGTIPPGDYPVSVEFVSSDTTRVASKTVSMATNQVVKAQAAMVLNSTTPTYGQTHVGAHVTGFGTPSGTVTFSVNGVPRLPAQTLDGSGNASVDLSDLTPGQYLVTATYGGDSHNAGVIASLSAVTVGKATPSITIGAVPPTSTTFGEEVTFTANIVSPAGTPAGTAGGTATLVIDGTPVKTKPVSSGVVEFKKSDLLPGSYLVSVVYNGDANFASAQGDLAGGQTVTALATTTALTITPGQAQFGNPVTLSANVVAGGNPASGSVVFKVGSHTYAPVPLTSGTATLPIAALAVGTYAVSAEFAAQTGYGPSTDTGSLTITAATSTVTVTGPAGAVTVGQSGTFTATVAGNSGTPTGSVIFTVDGIAQAPVALSNGQATSASVTFNTAGNHSVTAAYSGSVDYAPGLGALPGGQTVGKANTTTVLDIGVGAAEYGQTRAVTATVTSSAGPSPAGTVAFKINGQHYADAPLVGGVASLTLPTTLAVSGQIAIEATYAASANLASSTTSATLNVNSAPVTVGLSPNNPPGVRAGEPVTFTATASIPSGAASGQVEFLVDGVSTQTVNLIGGNAVATLSFGAGGHTVTARFVDNGLFNTGLPTAEASSSINVDPLVPLMIVDVTGPGVVNQAYTGSITAIGGTGAITVTEDPGGNHPGLTLNPDGSITGTPASAGTYTFNITATDSTTPTPGSVSRTISFTVQNPVTVGIGTVADGVLHASYTGQLALGGGVGALTASEVGTNLPPGLTLSSAGVISGTPTAVGTYNVTIAVTDANPLGLPANINVTIKIGPPVITATQPAANPVVGTPYSGQFTASGGTAPYTFSVGNTPLPAGLSLAADGTLSGTPTAQGPHTFTVITTDNDGYSSPTSISMTIGAAPNLLLPASLPHAVAGRPYMQSVAASNGTGTVTYSVSSGSIAPLTLDASTGMISGVVPTAQTLNFTVTANSTAPATGSQAYTLVVDPAPPITISGPGTIVWGATDPAVVTASGVGNTSFTFTLTGGALPAGLTLQPNGQITGSTTVLGPFTYTVEAEGNTTHDKSSQTLIGNVIAPTLTVTAPATLPAFGTAYTQAFSTSGGSGSYTYNLTGTLPQTLVLDINGQFSGTPIEGGNYVTSVTVTDTVNGATRTEPFSFSTTAPTITLNGALPTTGMVGQTPSGDVDANGYNVGYTLALAGNYPAGMTMNGSGVLAGIFTAAGTYNYDVVVTYANGYTVTLPRTTVIDSNIGTAIMPATIPNGQAFQPYSAVVAVVNQTGPFTYSIVGGALPAGVSLATDGTLSGTPTTPGAVTFDVQARNTATGKINVQTYGLTISSASLSASPIGPITAGAPANVTLAASGGNGSYTFGAISNSTLPATLSVSNSVLLGTPTGAGTYGFDVAVTDSLGNSGTLSYSVSVVAPTLAITGTPPGGRVSQVYGPFQFQRTGTAVALDYTVTGGGLPPGLGLATDGTISGTPTTEGTYHFDVSATAQAPYSFGTTGSYTITIATNTANATFPSTIAAATVGVPYNQSIAATNPGTSPTYTITSGGLPANLTLASNGTITGTALVPGSYPFTVELRNGEGYTKTQAYTLQVDVLTLVFPAPSVTSPILVGDSYQGNVGATGALTYSLVNGTTAPPPGLNIDLLGNLSGVATVPGTYRFKVLALNAVTHGSGLSSEITIEVQPRTLAVSALGALTGTEGVSLNTSVAATTGTGPFVYTLNADPLPPGLTLNPATGVISGTPTAAGTYANIGVHVTDAYGNQGQVTFAMTIASAPTPAVTNVTLNASPATAEVGEAITLTATVTPGTATGTVVFEEETAPGVFSTLATSSLAGGHASASIRFMDKANHVVRARYVGDANHAAQASSTIAITAVDADTTIAVTLPSAPFYSGTPLTIRAEVTRADAQAGRPGDGTIDFLIGGVVDGSVSTSTGTATYALTREPGTYNLQVNFRPDPATGLDQPVDGDPIALTVIAQTFVALDVPASALAGDLVTIEAEVDTVVSHTNDPAGQVQFMLNGNPLGAPQTLSGGRASLTQALPEGTNQITAVFNGSTFYAASSSSPRQIVIGPVVPGVPEATSLSLAASVNDPLIGQTVTFTADVRTISGARIPSGNVVFRDLHDVHDIILGIGTIDSSGKARVTYSFADSESHTIVATLEANAYFASSTASVQVTSGYARTKTVLSRSSTSTYVGDTLTLTANVTREPPAHGTPEPGIVEFTADGHLIGWVSTNGTGMASFTTDPLFETSLIEARYVASVGSSDLSSTSGPIRHPVIRIPVTFDIDMQPDGSGGLTVTIDIGKPMGVTHTPTGTVTISADNGAMPSQTATLDPSGHLTFALPPSALAGANTVFTIDYGGDTYFAPQQGTIRHHADGDTNISLSVSDTSPSPNQPVTFIARVTARSGVGIPSQKVRFTFHSATHDAEQEILIDPLTQTATATFSFPDATEGVMSVVYLGDGNFASTESNPITQRLMFDSLNPTQTNVTSSIPAAMVGQPFTLSATVTSPGGTASGLVWFYDGAQRLGSGSLSGGVATFQVPGLSSGIHAITAYYAGNADFAPSRSPVLNQRVIGTDAVLFTMSTRPSAFVSEGQRIEVVYSLQAVGGIDITGISIVGTGIAINCPGTVVPAGASMECTGYYVVTAADMQAGAIDFSATMSADGIGSLSSGTSISLGLIEVKQELEEITHNFVSTRQKLIASSINLPDIFDRLHQRPGGRPGTIFARADEEGTQVMAFSSSLSEVMSWGAAQAAENLATQVAMDPLPLNIWIDARMTLHAQTGVENEHWGSFGTLAMGADYLVTDRLLLGTVIQGDWMTDNTDMSETRGAGFLAGGYGSFALTEHMSVDGSLLYGRSWNTLTAKMFAETFKGDFETERLLANMALQGYWEIGALTLKPDFSFFISTEEGGDYEVTSDSGAKVLIEIDRQTEFKLGLGSAFEYRLDLEGNAVLTPKASFDFGFAGSQTGNEAIEGSIFGSASIGLDYQPSAGVRIDSKLALDFDTTGFRAITLRGGLAGSY